MGCRGEGVLDKIYSFLFDFFFCLAGNEVSALAPI